MIAVDRLYNIGASAALAAWPNVMQEEATADDMEEVYGRGRWDLIREVVPKQAVNGLALAKSVYRTPVKGRDRVVPKPCSDDSSLHPLVDDAIHLQRGADMRCSSDYLETCLQWYVKWDNACVKFQITCAIVIHGCMRVRSLQARAPCVIRPCALMFPSKRSHHLTLRGNERQRKLPAQTEVLPNAADVLRSAARLAVHPVTSMIH